METATRTDTDASGYFKLIAAVLAQAKSDALMNEKIYIREVLRPDGTTRRYQIKDQQANASRREAISWLWESETENTQPWTSQWCCETLGVDRRKLLERIKAREITNNKVCRANLRADMLG